MSIFHSDVLKIKPLKKCSLRFERMSFFLLLSVYITTTESISDTFIDKYAYRRKICEYIVQSLPIAINHVFWKDVVPPSLLNATKASRPAQIYEWLINQCINRYEFLIHHHMSNIEQANFGHLEKQTRYPHISKPDLYILDLDESVLYQDELTKFMPLRREPRMEEIRNYNSVDLQFSIMPFGVATHCSAFFIIYRQYLMEFIMHNIENSDFIIFTMATYDLHLYATPI